MQIYFKIAVYTLKIRNFILIIGANPKLILIVNKA